MFFLHLLVVSQEITIRGSIPISPNEQRDSVLRAWCTCNLQRYACAWVCVCMCVQAYGKSYRTHTQVTPEGQGIFYKWTSTLPMISNSCVTVKSVTVIHQWWHSCFLYERRDELYSPSCPVEAKAISKMKLTPADPHPFFYQSPKAY